MILFKQEHVPMILEGRKVQTRRRWTRPRVKVGSVHQAKTSYQGDAFAHLRITDIHLERLGDISDEDVRREGYESREQLMGVFRAIYRTEPDPDEVVTVVDFECVI